MIFDESLKKELKGKTALFDTCVLSRIRNNVKNSDVQNFLQTLDELNCKSSIHDWIKLEFLRDVNKNTELVERKFFVEALCQEFSLPITQDMYKDATVLSYIYVGHQNEKGSKKVEIVDLMSSVFLKKYNNQVGLVLITENHQDFPLTIHNRIGTLVLDVGKTVATLGFYRVDVNKWKKEEKTLLESSQWKSK